MLKPNNFQNKKPRKMEKREWKKQKRGNTDDETETECEDKDIS